MKKFTTQEIRDLYNRFFREEISFSRMVEILNEMVSEAEEKCIEYIPTYKRGDFLVKEYKDGSQYIFILDYIDDDGLIYYHCYHTDRYNSTYVADDFGIGRVGDAYHKCLRYATDREKELLIAELSIVGKRWNEKKKCVEDIPVRKLKKGDKVRIKGGVSSKTHREEYPCFAREMDDFIGKTMTVGIYTDVGGYVVCNEYERWLFNEDWLEPCVEELKECDLAIFWNLDKWEAFIGKYNGLLDNGSSFPHQDHRGNRWVNAIKFESVEQFNRFIKGEI